MWHETLVRAVVIKLWGEPRWWIAEPIQVGQRGEKRGRKTQIFIWGTSEFYDAAEVDSGFGCSSRASPCRDFFFFSVLLCSCWVGLVWMWVWLSVNDKDVTGAETAMMRALHLCQHQTQKSIWGICWLYFWLISGHLLFIILIRILFKTT